MRPYTVAPLRGAAFGLAGQVVARLIGFLFYAALARTFGPGLLGSFGVAAGAGYVCLAIVEPGLNLITVRDGAADLPRLRARLQEVFSYKITVALAGWTLITLAAGFGALGEGMLLAVCVVGGVTVLGFVEDMAAAACSALQRFDLDAGLRLGFRLVSVGGALAVVLTTPSVDLVLLALGIGTLLAAAGTLVLLRHHGLPLAFRFEIRSVLSRVRAELPLIAGATCWVISLRVDQVIGGLAGVPTDQIGLHTAAFKVVDALTVVAGTIATAFYPQIVIQTLAANGRGSDDTVEVALLASLAATAPLALGGAVLAPRVIEAAFGNGFGGAGLMLACLLGILPLSGVQLTLGHLAIVTRRRSAYGVAMGVNLIVHLVAACLLLPAFGMLGAVVAAVLGHASGALLLFLALRQRPLIRASWALRPIGGAVAMGLVLYGLPSDVPLPAVVATGVVLYCVAMGSLGVAGRLRPFLSVGKVSS